VGHHAGQRLSRGVGIVSHERLGPRQRIYQRRLAAVGRTDQDHLGGTFPLDIILGLALTLGASPGRLADLRLELRYFGLHVGLEFVGTLVLGHEPQQLLSHSQLLPRVGLGSKLAFEFVVLWRQVGRHMISIILETTFDKTPPGHLADENDGTPL